MKSSNKIKHAAVLLVLMAFLGLSSGCCTLDPQSCVLKVDLKWRTPQKTVTSFAAKKVYCVVRNSSGSDIDIRRTLYRELGNIGYEVIEDPQRAIKEAEYFLKADVRYYGLASEITKEKEALIFGGVAGGLAGAGAGAATSNDVGTTGLVAGALGAGIAHWMNQRNPQNTYTLIVDASMGQRVTEGINVEHMMAQGYQVDSVTATFVDSEAAEIGRGTRTSSSDGKVTLKEDFLLFPNTAVVTAEKRNLVEAEANEAVTGRLGRATANIMP